MYRYRKGEENDGKINLKLFLLGILLQLLMAKFSRTNFLVYNPMNFKIKTCNVARH